MNFDAKNPLVMNSRRTVLGHALNRGQVLTVVKDPKATGEVDDQTANLLFAKKLAVPQDAFRPTAEMPADEDDSLTSSKGKAKSEGHKSKQKSDDRAEHQTSAASGSKDHDDKKSKPD